MVPFKETLIIFTRYPEPGKTKTRLIPVLGPEGAALLHRRLSEHTLVQVKRFQSESQWNYYGVREGQISTESLIELGNETRRDYLLSVEVHFYGGSQELMAEWLGTGLIYQPQGGGDLGAKMAAAFQNVFQAGSQKAVMIGTDCPELTAAILTQAFEELNQGELVLGPAADGGYYLIGLRQFVPELFRGIHWGTASVLTETQAIAQTLNLATTYLPLLADIDRPEDLSRLDFID